MIGSPTRIAAEAVRPEARTALSAWRLSPDNPRHEARPLPIDNNLPLDQLARELAVHCQHKDRFVVRVSDLVTGKGMTHFYAIKRSTIKRWVANPRYSTGGSMMCEVYPVLEFSMAAEAFLPAEAFSWSSGCDPVGIDRGIIEGAAQ